LENQPTLSDDQQELLDNAIDNGFQISDYQIEIGKDSSFLGNIILISPLFHIFHSPTFLECAEILVFLSFPNSLSTNICLEEK
jgi:hypothetical protein